MFSVDFWLRLYRKLMPAHRYTISPQGGGTVIVPTVRRWAPGHWTALQLTQTGTDPGATFVGIPNAGATRFTGGHWVAQDASGVSTVGTIPRSNAGPVATNTKAIVMRFNWGGSNGLDNGNGTYNLGNMERVLAQATTFQGAPLLVYFIINIRTFDGAAGVVGDGTCPLPNNLICPTNPRPSPSTVYPALSAGTNLTTTYAYWFDNSAAANSGYSVWRWDATLLAQLRLTVNAIGAAFDSNPNFGGIGTQETATNTAAAPFTMGGYTLAAYQSGLILEDSYISTACPHGRHLNLINFMGPGNTNAQQTAGLVQVSIACQPNGTIIAGPDLITGGGTPSAPFNGGIVTRCYPIYNGYHFGTGGVPGKGATGCSVQNAEFKGVNPGDSPPNFPNLYNYATSTGTYTSAGALDWSVGSPLNLDIIIWDWHIPSNPNSFNPDATDIISAHNTFGTYNGVP